MDDELERIQSWKFIEFVKIGYVSLPVFLDKDNKKVIVTPIEYMGKCDSFCSDSNSNYIYFVKH